MSSEPEALHDLWPGLVAEGYVRDGAVRGFVVEPLDPGRIFVVELVVDGWPCRIAHAAFFEPLEGDLGEGFCHGFVLAVPDAADARMAEVRLANTSRVVVSGLDLSRSRDLAEANERKSGVVEWLGGLRLSGWLARRSRIRCILEGRILVEVDADLPRLVPRDGRDDARFGFEAFLPPDLADGCVHVLDIVDADGLPLHGSPVSIVAFAGGAAAALDESEAPQARLGRELVEALLPQSLPLALVEEWRIRFPPASPRSAPKAVALVMFGEDNLDVSLASLEDCACAWVLAVLPCGPSSLTFEAEDLIVFLETEAADCTAVVFCAAGTRLERQALALLDEALEDASRDAAFGDVVCIDENGRLEPLALPSTFDMQRALHQGLGVHLFALRRTLALRAARAGASDPFALLTHGFDADPRHVPGFLATCPPFPLRWARDALRAASLAYCRRHFADAAATVVEAARRPAIKLDRAFAAERLTLCIGVGDNADALAETLDNLRSYRGRHGLEFFLLDTGTTDQKTRELLSRTRGEQETVIAVDGASNRARAFNLAVEKARSRYVMFLPAGCHFGEPSLFEALLLPCQDRDVAGCGPCLVSAGGIVRAAGYVLGPRFSAAPAFADASVDDPGYDDLLEVGRFCGAAPMEGLLLKRSELVALGGLDERRFGRYFYAIDLALKLRARGRRLACVPGLHLTVPDWIEVALPPFIRRGPVAAGELATLRNVWGQALLDDPCYSGLLALDGVPYSALAWPPRGAR